MVTPAALLRKLESIRPFSEDEAWTLFRLAALSEAAGWTILIVGILIDHFKLPGHAYAVPIAGQIHGTIFLIYFGVLLTTYSSLRWSRKKFLLAILSGIPPYGTLAFEQFASLQRRNTFSRRHFISVVLTKLRAKQPAVAREQTN